MSGAASAVLLGDGRRLHLQHGPIDIIAEAFGTSDVVRLAYGRAAERFSGLLAELVEELAVLRRPVSRTKPAVQGPIARRMVEAVWPHRAVFVTPMAAVAGSVADEVLAAMTKDLPLARAYVNNGGDIAFHLGDGESLQAGIVDNQDCPSIDALTRLAWHQPARGLATSGWRGRSQSLGIADAVTVLAGSAAAADAAATLIANAVDADDPAIERRPASSLRDDTDLGDRAVTVAVGSLGINVIRMALDSGRRVAAAMRQRGLIEAAYISLAGERRVVGGEAWRDPRIAGLVAGTVDARVRP